MNPATELETVLGPSPAAHRRSRLWLWLPLLAALAGGALWLRHADDAAPRFKTATLERGDLTVTVTATGTLQPRNQVDVGTEVSGTVAEVLVDYNDPVRAGQVLARLDPSKLEAQAAQARASLALAEARLQEARAGLNESRQTLDRYRKMRKQSQNSLPSAQELDTAEATFKRAQAGEAVAQAQIAEAKAKLQIDETNLAKAVIRSPIAGIVLVRLVEPGQTVAASLQAPVLFSLAEDLAQMELQVDVDEADVGRVNAGQSAAFSVDAYPERSFEARITQVRYAPQSLNNVVTYKTLLVVDNADLSLRPGMTATADIVVSRLDNVLLVPNAALRFTPPDNAKPAGQNLLSSLLPRSPQRSRKPPLAAAKNGQQRLWIQGPDGLPQAVSVKLGASDGRVSQVLEGDLAEGALLLLEVLKNPA